MSAIDSLKAGQPAALKPTENDRIPGLRCEIASIDRGRILLQVGEAGRPHLRDYAPGLQCVMVWEDRGHGEQGPVQVVACEGDSVAVVPVSTAERREAPRVHTNAVFTYEVIPPNRLEEAAEEVRNTASSEPLDETIQVERLWHSPNDNRQNLEEEISRLGNQMVELNSKLDYLIALAEGRPPDHSLRRYREIQDFSGGGLAFLENKALPPGAALRMVIELSRFPRQEVLCLGEVTRCLPVDGASEEFNVGVQFTVINEDDRERIIRHVFKAQRRYLRNRKEKASE